MPRSAQYSRGRQLVLQGTLLFVLAATLGLAGWISQSRERASAVELTAKPHWAGKLAIRMPKDWTVLQDTDELPVTVIASESKPPASRRARIVEIHQFNTTAAPPEVLGGHLSKFEKEIVDVRPFSVLGQSGVLARVTVHQPIANDPFDRLEEVPAWFAAGVVPGAGTGEQNLAVVVGVRGQKFAGPAGEHAISQIIEGLQLRPVSPPTTLPAN